MTIIKLTLTVNKGYKYEPQEITYHINKEVAENYAKKKIAKGYTEKVYYGLDMGTSATRHYEYYSHYLLNEIFVNED